MAISEGHSTEYVWVTNFCVAGDVFRGTLNNEPRLIKAHKLGEIVLFHRRQIADRTYTDRNSGHMVGNFTACALLTREPPAEAAEFKHRYGLQCE